MRTPDHCCDHAKKVELMHKTLYGNGTPEKSLVVKVDRMDRSMRRVERVLYTIAIGVVMMFVGRVVTMIRIDTAAVSPVTTKAVGSDDARD
jgi:cell division protein FtsL